MLCQYRDILNMADECGRGDALWFDENGVPRFCDFHPTRLADIYARTAILCRVACQSCGKTFMMAQSKGQLERVNGAWMEAKPFPTDPDLIAFGDPPCWGCSGATMSSDTVEIVQRWAYGKGYKWERVGL